MFDEILMHLEYMICQQSIQNLQIIKVNLTRINKILLTLP